jgi:hypothetical protein
MIVATGGALLTVFVALLWLLDSAGKDDGIRSPIGLLGMVGSRPLVLWNWFKERYL